MDEIIIDSGDDEEDFEVEEASEWKEQETLPSGKENWFLTLNRHCFFYYKQHLCGRDTQYLCAKQLQSDWFIKQQAQRFNIWLIVWLYWMSAEFLNHQLIYNTFNIKMS